MVALKEEWPSKIPQDGTRTEPLELYRLRKWCEKQLGDFLVRVFEDEAKRG